MISVLVLMVAGLLMSGSLWRHRRILTLLAMAGALTEAGWLLLTLMARTVLIHYGSGAVYLTGSLVLLVLAGWLAWRRGWKWPYGETGSGVRDVMVLLVLVPVLAASYVVWQFNGLQADASLVWHGFFNGDTVTFLSLVKRAALDPGLSLGNPFSGLGLLEYPTLLHAGWAEGWQAMGISGDAMLHYLPMITLVQIVLTIPLFWLLWDEVLPEPADTRERWLGVPKRWVVHLVQAGVVGYVVSLSWDNYIYPQSHFFLTGLFLLAAAMWLRAGREKGKQWYLYSIVGLALTLVLMLTNAVTGTAALIIALAGLGWRVMDRKAAVGERQAGLVLALGLAAIFLVATPGEPAFGGLQLSYTAAFDVARLAGPILLVVAALFWAERVAAPLPAMVAGLMIAAAGVFVFSSRNIVVENSSRFLYHAVLVGFPVLGAGAVRLYYWGRRKLQFESRAVADRLSMGAIALVLGFLVLVPGLQAVASAHDNLQYKDERVISLAERDLMWWIEENVPDGSVIVANPHENMWSHLPALSGRALLRTEYWLSVDDVVLEDLKAAFAGDGAAREQVVPLGDYLLLTKEEQPAWEPVVGAKVFENSEAVLYEL